MRNLARAEFLKIIRLAVCAAAGLTILPFAGVYAAQAQTTNTETAHETTHKTTSKAAPKTTHESQNAHKTAAHQTNKKSATSATGHASTRNVSTSRRRRLKSRYHHHRPLTAREIARSRKLQSAFVASSQLRPMAQQLAILRSPAAYAGVSAYAHNHSGEAASAAYLALGHAYLLDHKYADAVSEFKNADREGTALSDYAAYLTAQAYLQGNMLPSAQPILATFIEKYPDSIFVPSVPILEANLLLQEGAPQNALTVLNAHKAESIANKADFQLALAKANLMSGNAGEAQQLFTHIYLDFPLSAEATQARAQLVTSGALVSMPASDRRRRADALYAAHRFTEAEEEYRSLAADSSLDFAARNGMLVAAAACQWKLKTLKRDELDRLPDTNDEAGARRLYLLMELARDKDDGDTQQSIVNQMESRFPTSLWLAEALYSSGNVYMLRKDYPNAIRYYSDLSTRFPKSCESPHTGPCSNYSPERSLACRLAHLPLEQLRPGRADDRRPDHQIRRGPGDSRRAILARPPLRRPGT